MLVTKDIIFLCIWKFKHGSLNAWVELKKIIIDIKKYLDVNNNVVATYQNLWNTAIAERISKLWYTLEYNIDEDMNDSQPHALSWTNPRNIILSTKKKITE